MGRLEKIVVLTVLFLVAVILGVSLNQGGDPGAPPAREVLADAPEGSEEVPGGEAESSSSAHEPGQAPVGPAGLLHSGVGDRPREDSAPEGSAPEGSAPEGSAPEQPQGPPATELEPDPQGASSQSATGDDPAPALELPASVSAQSASARQEEGATLLTTEGLSESLVPDVMIYSWAQGDSFPALAERYFGSSLEVGRLRKANEGRDESGLRPGDRIFVPCRATAPTERLTRSESVAGQWDGGSYRVQAGDMLGKIAQEVYGSAAKWRVIYDANRDILASPDDLQVGMALRIPRID